MNKLQVSVSILLFLLSSFYRSHTDNAVGHKIYCPEDMYGQEYLKFYNMTAFLTTWTTTGNNETVTIPTTGAGYFYDVAWGDGTTSVNQTGNASHVYATPGDYQISITGSFPRIYFNNSGDKYKIKSIDQWGLQPWISMESAFWGCTNLEELSPDAPNLTNVTSMENMFGDCSDLNQDISDWDVSNVINMKNLFYNAIDFNQDISTWDVSSVQNMSSMFYRAFSFNQPLNNWDVSSVTDMGWMFYVANSFNQPLNNWDVSSVQNMSYMFLIASSFNQPLNDWDVSSVTNMLGMFAATEFNQDISTWDVSNVTNMAAMFQNSAFNQDISTWDVSSVQNMSSMFSGATFNQDISTWDVSSVQNMINMFYNSEFNQDISTWDVSSVTDMRFMFYNSEFNQDISTWDVSSVQNMVHIFDGSSFDQNLNSWDISQGPDMTNMFLNSSLSARNYDQILIGWAQQSPASTDLGAGNTQYCLGADARDMLINTYGWNITDGGQAPTISIDNTFTNSNGNNLWDDAGNWSLGIRPVAIHNVIIPSGLTCIVEDWLLPTTFEDGLCYTIEVEDGAVFEVMDGATFRTAVPCNY